MCLPLSRASAASAHLLPPLKIPWINLFTWVRPVAGCKDVELHLQPLSWTRGCNPVLRCCPSWVVCASSLLQLIHQLAKYPLDVSCVDAAILNVAGTWQSTGMRVACHGPVCQESPRTSIGATLRQVLTCTGILLRLGGGPTLEVRLLICHLIRSTDQGVYFVWCSPPVECVYLECSLSSSGVQVAQ
jgi:hypothetical protein